MAGGDWSKTVELAVARVAALLGAEFTLGDIERLELPRIIRETASRGATPKATLRRELQELRDRGGIEFLGQGRYRLTVAPALLPQARPSKCVLVCAAQQNLGDRLDSYICVTQRWVAIAARAVGQWVIFQDAVGPGSRGYFAAARVDQIVRNPTDQAQHLILIEPGSFLEFGRDVPAASDPALVRTISNEEFDQIVDLGLIEEFDMLPREDAIGSAPSVEPKHDRVHEPFFDQIERETALVSRTVRDRQFRKRVLDAYDCRCALTGMRLINGGGRAETQAAHIVGVEHKGTDQIINGIALSGTVHWMFDRGLIALSDGGDILLSRKISDVDGVTKLLYPDCRARLPESEALRPHPRFLAWHREWHGIEV